MLFCMFTNKQMIPLLLLGGLFSVVFQQCMVLLIDLTCGVERKVHFSSATWRQLSWDDPVPDDLSNEWNSWQRSLCDLEHLSFPRCIIPAGYENGVFELHLSWKLSV